MQVSLVVLTLYLYDAQISFPSFFQVTLILWLPPYVHLRVKGSRSLKYVSSSFCMKRGGSEE